MNTRDIDHQSMPLCIYYPHLYHIASKKNKPSMNYGFDLSLNYTLIPNWGILLNWTLTYTPKHFVGNLEGLWLEGQFVEAIKEALSENDEIILVGFGRFIKSKVEARNGINPKSSKTDFKSYTEVKIFFMYDWLLTSIYPFKKHLKTCFLYI